MENTPVDLDDTQPKKKRPKLSPEQYRDLTREINRLKRRIKEKAENNKNGEKDRKIIVKETLRDSAYLLFVISFIYIFLKGGIF